VFSDPVSFSYPEHTTLVRPGSSLIRDHLIRKHKTSDTGGLSRQTVSRYRVQDTHLDRPATLKFLAPHPGADPDAVSFHSGSEICISTSVQHWHFSIVWIVA